MPARSTRLRERQKTPLRLIQAGESGDEFGSVAEQADAVIVAEPPALGQRVVLHDLLEVVEVVAGAQVAGGMPPPLAFIEEPHGGHVLPKGDALSAAVLLALGALPLQAAEPEPVLAPVLQPALPAGGVDIALYFLRAMRRLGAAPRWLWRVRPGGVQR